MIAKKALVSPRISSLEQALTSGDTIALKAFWQEAVERGSPLIEPIEGDNEHNLVTFLWREQENIKNVMLVGGPADKEHLENNQMMRLLDTDLWYRTYQVRANLRTTYLFSLNNSSPELKYGVEDLGTRLVSDPLNPRQFVYRKDEEIPDDRDIVVSVLELPSAPPQHWIIPRTGGAKGQVEMYRLHSRILNNERRVWVYTPPAYTTNSAAYSLLLLFDGREYIDLVPTPTILDNLINDGRIPPLVAVLPDSLDQETRNREMTCYQPFADFLTRELMPWVHEHYHVTYDPARTVVAGSSLGGLTAAFLGLQASEIFGNVLSQSGSFWWNKDPEDNIPQAWLIQQFVSHPRLALRFYLEIGLQEKEGSSYRILCHRHLRDVLSLKGYEIYYTEFNGGHDYVCWRGSLADGLLALVGDKPA
jgi:enterochelin esterase-like enzyme